MGADETGAPQLAPGDMVGGRYRVERFLARGAHSEVYAVVDSTLGERLALKLLKGQALAEEQVALFKREAKLARQVSHPNVCRLYGYDEEGGRHFLTLELLEGETLAARLARGPLSSDEVGALARQLCAGLQAIHAVGVVHRDLKPANIFVGARAVIADFGVARSVLEGGAASSALAGTPAYMAPEQLWGEAVSPATDLYTLGLVLFECLTGKRPFDGETLQALSQRRPPPLLGNDWDTVLQRCLAPRAAERFQRAQEVATALPLPDAVAALLPTATPSTGLLPTATPSARPNRGFRFATGTWVAGRYRVLRQLARGGMGEVYEVEDTQLGEVVALKLLDASLATDALARERFQGEVKAARRVTHPNVCRIFDLGLHDDGGDSCLFLTMELLSGPTLEERLRSSRLPPDEAVSLLEQVASALDAAHAVGVVHRDLKPSNIMLVRFSGGGTRAVVTDFGIARRLDEATVTRDGWVGTPAYIAPEQLEGKPVSPSSDVYSLGVILFEVATGRLPFTGSTALEVALQRLAVPAPLARTVAPDVSPQWELAIARCLQREPSARWPSASAAIAALADQAHAPRASDALPTGAPPTAAPLSDSTPRTSEEPPASGGASSVAARADSGGSPGTAPREGDLRPPERRPHNDVVQPPPGRRGLRAALAVAAVLALAGAGFALVSKQPALPPSDRVLSVEVVGEPDVAPGRDDVLPPFDEAAAWVVRRSWRNLETQRRFRVSPDASGNVVARLRWSRAAQGVTARLEVGPPGGLRALGPEVNVGSIRAAAEALYPALAAHVGAGQETRVLWPDEAVRARQSHAPSPEAYLEYARIFDGYWARQQVDGPRYTERTRQLVAQFPAWGLPALLLCCLEGLGSESCRRSEVTAMAAGQPADISDIFATFAARRAGKGLGTAASDLKTLSQDPEGPIAEMRSLLVLGANLIASRRPDLQFRANLLGEKKAFSGHLPEAREDLRAWLSSAPGQDQAWILAASLEVTAGKPATRTLEELLRLHGNDPDILLCSMDIELAQFHSDAALALAVNAETPSPYYAALNYVRVANAYLMKGKFRRARDQLINAREWANGLGVDFAWIQTSRDLVTISGVLGERDAAAKWRGAMLEDFGRQGDAPEHSVGVRYLDLAAQQRCPPPERLLVNLEPAAKHGAERVLARLAVRGGCGDCAQVLANDETDIEGYLDTVTVLASCLEAAGRTAAGLKALEPHLRYVDQNLGKVMSISVPEVVRVQYWHGRLLQQSGDLAGARADYARFIELWGEADAPIPEMADARARLKSLTVE